MRIYSIRSAQVVCQRDFNFWRCKSHVWLHSVRKAYWEVWGRCRKVCWGVGEMWGSAGGGEGKGMGGVGRNRGMGKCGER